ncbi:MAG: Flp pilus assembly protein CpaB [Gemmatimonadetes bacterium]|nr:Flp pilus assembly protein CpaB [Gemmatimonadota bacterium]NIQ56169.1 Flp pilus assembly protein CpaB [Gemmatimonadota bacterium]NIU76360.1 Flp pilus assembly protein CpaB [Gammaproteobacteria bacterium]NIX45840.1 Flp pilus assembly protein CpaB [Gemmatimonadota bacterium]NIY10146.1 Flp pilus assembly protein CpaB [Gemmatimonadota bacterium]
MKQRRVLIILLLALVAAAVAGFSTLRFLSTRPVAAAAARPDRRAQVVVATRALPVGALLKEEDVRVIDWPAESVPENYVTVTSDVIGRGLISAVRTNEPILTTELAEKGSGAGLPIIIPEGKRALSIRVDEVIAVAGFVIPHTRVDVLLTLEQNDQPRTQVILQNMTVLAAGQVVQRDEEGNPMNVGVVTLLVTPQEAEKLTLAAQQGRIQLALRNMIDVEEAATDGIRANALMTGPTQRTSSGRVVPRRPTAPVVELYRGGARSIQRF